MQGDFKNNLEPEVRNIFFLYISTLFQMMEKPKGQAWNSLEKLGEEHVILEFKSVVSKSWRETPGFKQASASASRRTSWKGTKWELSVRGDEAPVHKRMQHAVSA